MTSEGWLFHVCAWKTRLSTVDSLTSGTTRRPVMAERRDRRPVEAVKT